MRGAVRGCKSRHRKQPRTTGRFLTISHIELTLETTLQISVIFLINAVDVNFFLQILQKMRASLLKI